MPSLVQLTYVTGPPLETQVRVNVGVGECRSDVRWKRISTTPGMPVMTELCSFVKRLHGESCLTNKMIDESYENIKIGHYQMKLVITSSQLTKTDKLVGISHACLYSVPRGNRGFPTKYVSCILHLQSKVLNSKCL